MKFVKRANCLKDSMLQIAPSSQGLWKRLAKDLAVKVAGQKTQQRVKNNNVILDSFQDLNPKLSGSPTGHH